MKPYGDWMFERRHGSVALRWHSHYWGVGIDLGTHFDDWKIVSIDECYRVMWVKFALGPIDLELACYGKGRKWEKVDRWIPLRDLREGAIFETKDGDVAMKTAYYRENDGECDCYRVSNGQRIYYGYGDNELVHELSEGEW